MKNKTLRIISLLVSFWTPVFALFHFENFVFGISIQNGQELPLPWIIDQLLESSASVNAIKQLKKDLPLDEKMIEESFKHKLYFNSSFTKLNDQVFFFNMNGNNTQIFSGDANYEKNFRMGTAFKATFAQRYTHNPCGLSLSGNQAEMAAFQTKIAVFQSCIQTCKIVAAGGNPATCIAACGDTPKLPVQTVDSSSACVPGLGESTEDRKYWNSSLKFTVRQALLANGFGRPYKIQEKLLQLGNLLASLKADADLNNLITLVASQYYQIAMMLEDLTTKREALKRAERLYFNNEKKFQTGRLDKTDLLTTKASLIEKKKEIQSSELNLRLALMRLAQIIGVPYQEGIIPKAKLEPLIGKQDEKTAIEQALIYRIDYKQVEIQKNMIQEQIKLQEENLKLGLNFFAQYELNGATIKYIDASKMQGYNYTVGLNLVVPIDEVGAEVQIEKLKGQEKQLIIQESNLKDLITVEVNEQVHRIDDLEIQVTEQNRLVNLKKERLQNEEEKFALGRSNIDLLVRYEDDLAFTQLILLKTRVEHSLALLNLLAKENTLLKHFKIPLRTLD